MRHSFSLPFRWIMLYVFCVLSHVQSAPVGTPHEGTSPVDAPEKPASTPSPQLYVIQHDINTNAANGCTAQQMAYLDKTTAEALLLVKSSLKLLRNHKELDRSLAWTYMGGEHWHLIFLSVV